MIVFSHANSFPASTYKVLFRSLRGRGFSVKAIEKYGHDPRYPVTNNWPHLVQQLCDLARHEVALAGHVVPAKQDGTPVWLVGHSLGGYLSLMAALRLPEGMVRGVVLIDSPLLGGWKSSLVGLAKRMQMAGSFSPGAVSKSRRNSWASVDEAFAHFRPKKAFAHWDAQVLHDYAQYGTEDHDGKRLLAFDRQVETDIYNALPHNIERQLKRHPLHCPVHFIGGSDSKELRRVGIALTQKVTQGRISMLEGSHLFPMEKPIDTAAAIEAAVRSMQA